LNHEEHEEEQSRVLFSFVCFVSFVVQSLVASAAMQPTALSSGEHGTQERTMIRKLKSGEYRLYSRKTDPKTGKRKNLGTFGTRAAAEKHEREVQYFKRH
jgi:hypothetical protein